MTKIPVHFKKVMSGLNKLIFKSITWYLMAVVLFVLSIVFLFLAFLDEKPFESTYSLLAIIYLLSALMALVYGIICRKSEAKKSKYGYREYLLQELKKEQIVFTPDENINIYNQNADNVVDENIADAKRIGKKDILAQMLDNNDEIKDYFKISKNQAKISFGLSIITCIAGVIMLAIAFYWAIIVKKYEMAIFGIVSGAIGEVISGTVLWVHNKSALQLNHYYDALHQNEKFLSAINMADRLSAARREEMYIEIIRKQTEIQLSNDTNT